mmetsp:Transcript_20388/g.19605  ORF Transcript_20388/g.19605 Transcript_20388/m.19605 type:complete len:93 (+) Transcript_20388:316-594(+)
MSCCLRWRTRKIKGHQVHLDVDPKAIPSHSKSYSIPKLNDLEFRKELHHVVQIGVLRPCGPIEWAVLTFVIPKKDGRVRWISDFRELNKALK